MNPKVTVTREDLVKILQDNVSLAELTRLTEQIASTVMAKNHDYGDAWQTWGIFTPLVRINDKLLRLETLTSGQTALVINETIQDTLRDLIGYAMLALLWLRKQEADYMGMVSGEPDPVQHPHAGLKVPHQLTLDERIREIAVAVMNENTETIRTGDADPGLVQMEDGDDNEDWQRNS